ncbi:MAG: hypothetical protein R3325_08365 [Thermoanaerobaculia bacterium]|nr:hypothetical protein [Thermoanaerobaculia bacterium]
MASRIRYLLLLALKYATRLFYRYELRWLHSPPPGPWPDLRVIALLHHTSLFEWLYVGLAPNHILKALAYRAVIPAADVTLARPFIGRFLRAFGADVVPITREKDSTWAEVLSRVAPNRVMVILPEGRMMRADGLDKHGRPMTVRGGIADILRAIPAGRMLLAYSGGLHHIQIPGHGAPRLFRRILLAGELVEIGAYKKALGGDADPVEFKRAVIEDLEHRRDLRCGPLEVELLGRERLGRRSPPEPRSPSG